MATATTVKDPVCGMDVETTTAARQTEYKGQTYYFCGMGCKKKFDNNPEQYLADGAPKSGGCCCSVSPNDEYQ
jgi:Cu+-exporting ATPase